MRCQGLYDKYCQVIVFDCLPDKNVARKRKKKNFWQLTQTIDILKMRWQKLWQLMLAALLP